MKTFVLASALTLTVWAVGCAKSDSGGSSAAAGCGAGAVQTVQGCMAQANCDIGTAQSPQEPSMCMDIRTSQIVGQQKCGSGYYLTAHGCLEQGPCPSGQALYAGDACIAIVANTASVWTTNAVNTTNNMQQVMPNGMMNGNQMNPFGTYQFNR